MQSAQLLNNYVVNIGENLAKKITVPNINHSHNSQDYCPHSFFLSLTNSEEVEAIIRMLKIKKATLSWDIDIKFIKLACSIISPIIISDLFNLCVKSGVFPDDMKVAEVISIFEQGSKMNRSKYRPISLLSSFSKIFEKIVYKRVCSYLLKCKLPSPSQFGFQCGVSTSLPCMMISAVYDDLLNNADKKYYSCCLFLDLSKAFDTVDHNILLRKISGQFGIRGLANKFFESYLSNRFQYVRLNNSRSKKAKIIYGIPQGSNLGPLLFLMYINDLPKSTCFITTLFADDTYLSLSSSSLIRLKTQLNNEINKVDKWLRSNKLSLNYKKSSYLVTNKFPQQSIDIDLEISINDTKIIRNKYVKYLGLWLDDN